MELWVILLVVGGVIALAVLGTAFMPKLPSSSEEKEEMDLKAEEKRILKSGAVTSKRKWFAIQVAMGIPVINLILLLVIAFKKEKSNRRSKRKKNPPRSNFSPWWCGNLAFCHVNFCFFDYA